MHLSDRVRSVYRHRIAVVSHTVVGAQDASLTLCCHPGGPYMSGRYFGDLAGIASERVRVVQVHPRGTAGTPPPADGDYSLERYADDLDELREYLGLERLDLLGHSHGGFVALAYATCHPSRLGHLVLVCTAATFSDELRAVRAAAMEAMSDVPGFAEARAALARRDAGGEMTADELGLLMATMLGDPAGPGRAELRAAADEEQDWEAVRWFNEHVAPTYDMRPHLAAIVAPTLVLNGALDAFGPRVSARELAAIPGARVTILDGVGHFPFLEAPDRFRAELEDFLAVV